METVRILSGFRTNAIRSPIQQSRHFTGVLNQATRRRRRTKANAELIKKHCVEPPLDRLKAESFDGPTIAKHPCVAGSETRAPTAQHRRAISRSILGNYTRGSSRAMRAFGVLIRIARRRCAAFVGRPCISMLRHPQRCIFATRQKIITKRSQVRSDGLRKSVKCASDGSFGFLSRNRLKQGPFACAPKCREKMFVCVSSLQHTASRPREKSPAKPGSMTSGMSNTDSAAGPVILPHMRDRPRATSGGSAEWEKCGGHPSARRRLWYQRGPHPLFHRIGGTCRY